MKPSAPPFRNLLAFCSLILLGAPAPGGAQAPAPDNPAALLAVSPRTNLPPDDQDPARPPKTRRVKPGSIYWTDDVGVDDHGNPYNQTKRSSFGTWNNYDEARADVFALPAVLVLKNGQPVGDAATWWQRRRPEILGDFLTEIYGRIPAGAPAVSWSVASAVESNGVKTKTIVGRIDNSAFPGATPSIRLSLALPAGASGPVPVMVVVSRGGGGDPRPGAGPIRAPSGPPPQQQVLARGWGYAVFDATSLQPDNTPGLTRGIIGLVSRGRARGPEDWGTLTAWAWGLSRIIDYLETDPDVDARRLGVEGHSRWGKTALWAAALDQRWAIVYASCSGEGGAKLLRRNYGETPDNLVDSFSHWLAPNFRKYGGHWGDLPVDAHELIALVAPRPVFVTGGTQDRLADPHGEFLAAVGAGPVYRLLGARDLGSDEMPAPNLALVSGEVAFREHIGPHTDELDWPVFLAYAARYFQAPAPRP
jgi:hypothetical protein